MIPQQWQDDRRRLLVLQHAQSKDGYPWSPGEEAITDAQYAVLDATPVTTTELEELRQGVRGEYRAGDTRGFVFQQELACARYNCWMVRGPDGTPTYHSEPVVA